MKNIYLYFAPILFSVSTLHAQPTEIRKSNQQNDNVAIEIEADDTEVESEYDMFEYVEEAPAVEAVIEMGNYMMPDEPVKKRIEKDELLPAHLLNHPYIKYQHQINEPGVAEAYPWISADGLRMYFTKNNEIYYSERFGRYEEFGKSQIVDMEKNKGFNNAWLTNDELTMYCTNSNNVLVFERRDVFSRFRFTTSFNFNQYLDGFISAVSFTPDKQTMVVYNSNKEQSINIFNMSHDGKTILSMRKKLTVPFGNIAVGQLSKDGNWLYFSVDEDPEFAIYKINMMDIDLSTPTFHKVLHLNGVRIGKPSLSYDETFMVFNATSVNKWNANEIMVVDLNNLSFIAPDTAVFALNPNETAYTPAYEPTVKEVKIEEVVTELVIKKKETSAPTSQDFKLQFQKIFPNPTDGTTQIEYHLPINCAVAELFVQDQQGREVMRKKLSKDQNTFSFSFRDLGVAKGTYVVWINTELGVTETKKVIYQ